MHTWADDFRTYEDACRYYGADTPAQLEAEAREYAAEAAAEIREWEAALGPYVPVEAPIPF